MATFPLSAKAVFDEAVEIASPHERRDYLERACADAPVLRQQVEALLCAYADAGSFLETPPVPPGDTTDLRPAAERPGTMIGPFKLLQQIGEGGMGVVWMAEQTHPVHRKVALKVIKPGMDSKQVVARFEAERQALAVMDHVNIARVFDGGTTEAGLPYFVMELVHGVPITKYCDDNRLTPRERLELFVPVCQAIQHAHQKGIIHRDIKPSNVMVTLYDGRPVPKVIDFGVAKATEQKPSDRTLFTQCGTLIGTLEYMSPEQAEVSAQGIDTRSDIFSLGVLLYELLTGSTPLTHERMKQSAHAELLRLIKEEEPQKPSTRLGDSGEELASISANRDTEPARLTKLMRGDLDWILMKCLEKDRTRRYETASGLAVDIMRHLNDETVTAGAPGAGYRLRKFVKRYRAQVIAAGIVVGALVLGVVGTTTGMVWALDERDRANIEKNKASLAAESEGKARKRAETISEFVTTALEAGDAENIGAKAGAVDAGYDMTILAAMDNAIRDIDAGRFKGDAETEAELRNTIGIILRNNGQYEKALRLQEQVLAIRERLYDGDDPIVGHSLFNLAEVYRAQSQYAEAEPLYKRALALFEKTLGPDDTLVAKSLNSLAALYRDQARYTEAEPLFTRALVIRETALGPDDPDVAMTLNSLAMFYKVQGKDTQAEPLYTRALAIREKFYGPFHPSVANSLSNLANVYVHPSQYAEAERLYTRALAIREQAYGPHHSEVAMSLNNLGALYQNEGKYTAAEPLVLRALAIWEEVLGPRHPDALAAKGNLAALYWSQHRLDKSIPLFEEVLEGQEAKHSRQHPDTLHTVGNLGVNYKDAGRLAEAIPLLEEAYRASKQYRQLGFVGGQLLDAYAKAGDYSKPESTAKVTTLMQEMLAAARTLPPDDLEALKTKGEIAFVYWSQGNFGESVPLYEEVLEGREATLGRQHQDTLTMVGNLGVNYLGAGRLPEAIALLEEAYRASEQYPQLLNFAGQALLVAYTRAADPKKPESTAKVVVLMQELLATARATLPKDSPQLASQLASHGQELLTLEAWDEAEILIREALTMREANAPDYWATFNARSLLGGALLGQNRLAEAEPLLLDGYRGMKEREAAIPAVVKVRIPEALERLVRLYEAKGNETEAAAWRSRLAAVLAERGKADAKGGGR